MLNEMDLNSIENKLSAMKTYYDELIVCQHLMEESSDEIRTHLQVELQQFCIDKLKIKSEQSAYLINKITKAVEKVITDTMEEDSSKLREYI